MRQARLFITQLGIAVLLLILLEVLLRLFFPRPNEDPEGASAFQFHPNYLVSLKPNIKKQFIRKPINGRDTILWKTNQFGFRGEDLEEKDLRIMIYGDSNIHARFTELQNSYPWLVEELLQEQYGRSVEVINAGVVGFGPDQSLLKFKEEKDRFKPDLVILQIFADNDFGDLFRNKLFKIGKTGSLEKIQEKRQLDPVIQEHLDKNKPWGYLRIMDLINKLRRSIKDDSHRIDAERMIAVCSKLAEEEYQTYQGKSSVMHSHFADHYDLDVATEPTSEIAKNKIQLMDRILQKFHEEATSSGIRLVVFIQPSAVDVSTNSYLNYHDLTGKFPNYRPNNLTGIIANACIKHRIPNINFIEHFENKNGNPYFFLKGNDHWNDLGQKKAAEITASFLMTHLLEKRPIATPE